MGRHIWAIVEVDYHIEVVPEYQCATCKVEGGDVWGHRDIHEDGTTYVLPVRQAPSPFYYNAKRERVPLPDTCSEAREVMRIFTDEEEIRQHDWFRRRRDRGYVATDFWVCARCDASGGPAPPSESKPHGKLHLFGTGIELPNDCLSAKRIIDEHKARLAKSWVGNLARDPRSE